MTAGARTKRLVDVLVGGILLVLTAPIQAAIALGILATMGSPVLYRERRAGLGGAPFEVLKFRTMRPLRPGETIPESDAARITRIGRVLRSASLDELPTLVNVVQGTMSLVGPRPLPVRYVERYDAIQARRLEVRPGVTGWAQVNGRNTLSWSERFDLDVWYVDHQNLRLDVRILFRTVSDVFARRGISHEGHATMPEFTGADGDR